MIKRPEYPCGVAGPSVFFLRSLEDIAPDCYLKYNPDLRVWEIWKDVEIYEEDDHKRKRHMKVPTMRAAYEALDQRALDNLRYRRWVGNRYMSDPNIDEKTGLPKAYLRWLKKEETEAKVKEKELGLEMMTHGFMEAYETSRKTSVS